MFHQFRPKIRVYGNRRHECNFKATINHLISNDVDLVWLQSWYLGFSKVWKFWKINKIFNIFIKIFPLKIKNQQTVYGRWQWLMNMFTKFQVDIFKNDWVMTLNMSKKQALFTSFRDFTVIFLYYFFIDFDASKVLGSFFAFFAKLWPKKHISQL